MINKINKVIKVIKHIDFERIDDDIIIFSTNKPINGKLLDIVSEIFGIPLSRIFILSDFNKIKTLILIEITEDPERLLNFEQLENDYDKLVEECL